MVLNPGQRHRTASSDADRDDHHSGGEPFTPFFLFCRRTIEREHNGRHLIKPGGIEFTTDS